MERQSVRDASARIDELLDDLEQRSIPAVLEQVQELVACVMDLHGEGLERILEVLGDRGDATGPDGLARLLADDEVVGSLLVLHGLHPDDTYTRVERALEEVRPYLGSHAGGVELLGVGDDGVVRLRLQGSCDGCPSSALTVKSAIEDAILLAAPDVLAVEAEGMVEEGPSLLQIRTTRPDDAIGEPAPDAGPPTANAWHPIELDVPPRTVARVPVAGERLAVANLDGTLVAYLDQCPGCGEEPSAGRLDGDRLACPGCRTSYDLRHAGVADTGQLVPVPLLPEHGAWKVALPHRVGA